MYYYCTLTQQNDDPMHTHKRGKRSPGHPGDMMARPQYKGCIQEKLSLTKGKVGLSVLGSSLRNIPPQGDGWLGWGALLAEDPVCCPGVSPFLHHHLRGVCDRGRCTPVGTWWSAPSQCVSVMIAMVEDERHERASGCHIESPGLYWDGCSCHNG